MKKIIFSILLLGVCFPMLSQQLTQYSNFVSNYVMLNPATVGSVKCLEFNVGHRTQWTKVEGHPVTSYANIQGNFGKKKFNFHGLGMVVENDVAGAIVYTTLSVAYAYHMKINRKNMMSFGLSAGMMQYKLDYSLLTPLDYNDPVIRGSVSEVKAPYMNTGVWLYNSKYFLGFSVRNVVGSTLKELEVTSDTKLIQHFEFTGGKTIELHENFNFKPAFQLKVVGGSKPALDIQGMIDYLNKFSFGMGARSGNGLVFLTNLTVKKYVTLSYAYDRTLSKMKLQGVHSHEFMLSFNPCKGYTSGNYIKCAAYD